MGNCCSFEDDDTPREANRNRRVIVQPPAVSSRSPSRVVTNSRPNIENQMQRETFNNTEKEIERELRKKAHAKKLLLAREKQNAAADQQRRQYRRVSVETENANIETYKKILQLAFEKQRELDLCSELKSLSIESPKRVNKNTEIIDDFLTAIGSQPNYSPKSYQLENLEQFSWEYQRVERLFRATNKRCFIVQKIEKVTNPYLLIQYNMKKLRYMAKHGGSVEQEMFHGTKKCNVDGICSSNLNWRLRGTALGHKFGQGTSFSPISNYATHYGDEGYDKVMFVLKVLIGNKCMGAQHMILPPSNYDTTTNDKEHVIVKYEDNEFYPTHLIHYGGTDFNKNKGGGRRRGYNRNYD